MKIIGLVLALVLLSGCDFENHRLLSPEASGSLEETGSALLRALSNKTTFGEELEQIRRPRPTVTTRCETHPDYLGGYRTVCRTR